MKFDIRQRARLIDLQEVNVENLAEMVVTLEAKLNRAMDMVPDLNAIYDATVERDGGIAILAQRCLEALPL